MGRFAVPQRRYFSDYGRPGRAAAGPNILPYVLVALLAAGGLLYLHNSPAPVPTAPPQTLAGTLVDATSGVPLSGVLVGVRDAGTPGTVNTAHADPDQAGITASGAITVAGVMTGPVTPLPLPMAGAAV